MESRGRGHSSNNSPRMYKKMYKQRSKEDSAPMYPQNPVQVFMVLKMKRFSLFTLQVLRNPNVPSSQKIKANNKKVGFKHK